MTEEEWLRTSDVPAMLKWLRDNWRGEDADLDMMIRRYCLACCRKIWKLLPHKASRRYVKVAERFVQGAATKEELDQAQWDAEGAYFEIQYRTNLANLGRWQKELGEIPPEELHSMIQLAHPARCEIATCDLLEIAAYFASYAGRYHGVESRCPYPLFSSFLPAPLLREIVGNPFLAGKPEL